jgi:integrase
MASIQKTKSGYRAQVKKKGVRVSQVFPTKMQARAWATEKEYEIEHGEAQKAETRTVDDLIERYKTDVCPTKEGARWERIRLGLISRMSIAKIKLQDLAPEHLAAWRDERLKSVKSSSVNRELNLLSAMFNRAVNEWGWLKENPISKIKRPKNPKHRDRRISDEERDAVLEKLGYTGLHPVTQDYILTKQHLVGIFFLLALETAMRLSEICNLKPEDVFDKYVVVRKSKNGDKRNVPLSKEAKRLVDLIMGSELTVKSDVASTLFRRAVLKAGIEDLTFHDSRHEAVTRLAQKLDVLDLARMVGHRDLKSLMIYYNSTPEELANRLD